MFLVQASILSSNTVPSDNVQDPARSPPPPAGPTSAPSPVPPINAPSATQSLTRNNICDTFFEQFNSTGALAINHMKSHM